MVPLKLFRRKAYKRRVGYKSIKEELQKAFVQLILIFNAHMLLYFIFEPVTLFNAFWHTYTVITTVGFGDIYATTTAGKWTTIIFGFSLGIWLLANFVSVLIEFKTERNKQKKLGNWRWKLKNPITIIGSPQNNAEHYFRGLLTQIRKTSKLEAKDILIVSTQFEDGLPESLSDLGAVLLNKKSDDKTLYEDENVKKSEIIYIIAKEEFNSVSNAVTYNVLSLLQENNIKTHIIAETTKSCDRKRFLSYGATAVIKPMRAYPKMVVRAMVDKHNAIFIENMFSSRGDEPIVIDVKFTGTWKEMVIKCLDKDTGTPVGYINKSGNLVSNPSPRDNVDTIGIQFLIKNHTVEKEKDICKSLSN